MPAFEEVSALHFRKFDEIITLETVCVRVCVSKKKKINSFATLEKQMLKLAFNNKSATTEGLHTNIGESIWKMASHTLKRRVVVLA